MTKIEKAKFIQKELQRLYPNPQVPLSHKDSFTLLVAVVLSAQCTDLRVNLITPKLFTRADTPETLAKLPPNEVEDIIRPCGLAPTKSKAIVGLSHIIATKHAGQVPQTFEELEALPGVGHKTASVVMVQAFNTPAFPVDTHIHRLATRWGLTSGKSVTQTEKDLKALFPKKIWHDLHLQMIFYGREYCSARACNGSKCPICQVCGAQKIYNKRRD